METKICKLCKHGYPQCTNQGMTCWCYLSAMRAPVQKDPYDTCPNWTPDYDEDEDEDE